MLRLGHMRPGCYGPPAQQLDYRCLFDELFDEAVKLQESGQVEAAIEKLDALLQQEPDHVLAHAALSVYHGKLDQHDKAVEHARKVCELDPDDPFSYVALSMICQKADQKTEAEMAMQQAMEKQLAASRENDQ